jgi:RNA polymerase sigma factor (sigma-70 family)
MLRDECQSLTLYRRELERLPQLSDEQAQALVDWMLQACEQEMEQRGTSIRNSLVEGSLYLVLPIAQRYAARGEVDVLDLIQEGNLGLLERLEAGASIDQSWRAYASELIHRTIAHALMDNRLMIRVPRTALRKAHQHGQAEQLYAMQPESLEAPLPQRDGITLADLLEAPSQITEPEQTTHHRRQQVKQLLAALPERERLAIEWRFGLAEDDQREHSYAEIAHKLDIQVSLAYELIQRGLAMLAGSRETPEKVEARRDQERKARLQARIEDAQRRFAEQQRRAEERQMRLDAAYQELLGQPDNITAEALASRARVNKKAAVAYLQQVCPDEARQLGMQRKTWLRLVSAYRRLQAQQSLITPRSLGAAAGVPWRAASRFLNAREPQQQREEVAVC